jgi:hypothetical protein
MISLPCYAQAETFEYFNNDGVIDKEIVVIDGEVYILSTQDEIKKSVKDSVELKSSKAEVALLFDKVTLLEDRLTFGEEIQEAYREELEYNYEYISKLKTLNERPFYKEAEFGLVVGAITMALTFFLWEFARNQ